MTAYLDFAGLGLVRDAAREAMHEVIDEVLTHGAPAYDRYFRARERARRSFANLLECTAEEIAFVPNTGSGLHIVASGLDWSEGDEVVALDRDFPANIQPWRQLRNRGVRLVLVPLRDNGYDLDDIAAAIGPATRLVAVSDVNFCTGHRLDLSAVCELARPFGALVSVDAVQSLGALPLSVRNAPVDFLSAGGQKWLCGPPGTGIFFCRRDRLDTLGSAPHGWFGYEGANDLFQREDAFHYDLEPRPTARRFEGGTLNVVGIAGLAEAVAEVESVGIEKVAARVLQLAARLRAELSDLGCEVSGGIDSGIVSVITRHARAWYDDLTSSGFRLSIPDGRLRLSTHFWSDDSDVDIVLNEFARLQKQH